MFIIFQPIIYWACSIRLALIQMLIQDKAKTEVVNAPMIYYHVKRNIHWKKITESKINEKSAPTENQHGCSAILTK